MRKKNDFVVLFSEGGRRLERDENGPFIQSHKKRIPMMAQLVPIIFINNNTNTHHLHALSPFSDAEGSAGVNLVVGSQAFREIYDPNQSLADFEWRIKLRNGMKPTLIKTSLSPNPDTHNENCLSCSLTFTLVSIARRAA